MIKIEFTEVVGWIAAIRGARNPMNSWSQSDTSYGLGEDYIHDMEIGPRDLKLLRNLANAGPDHGKYLRFIQVYCDITGPIYWLKEMDTYRMGVEKNSCSTMHKIHSRDLEVDDFSHDRNNVPGWLEYTISVLNACRERFLDTNDKRWWYSMIQILPSSYNQRRTYMFSYAALRNIYHARKHHKLDEWREFCRWVESLPYSELITGEISK